MTWVSPLNEPRDDGAEGSGSGDTRQYLDESAAYQQPPIDGEHELVHDVCVPHRPQPARGGATSRGVALSLLRQMHALPATDRLQSLEAALLGLLQVQSTPSNAVSRALMVLMHAQYVGVEGMGGGMGAESSEELLSQPRPVSLQARTKPCDVSSMSLVLPRAAARPGDSLCPPSPSPSPSPNGSVVHPSFSVCIDEPTGEPSTGTILAACTCCESAPAVRSCIGLLLCDFLA